MERYVLSTFYVLKFLYISQVLPIIFPLCSFTLKYICIYICITLHYQISQTQYRLFLNFINGRITLKQNIVQYDWRHQLDIKLRKHTAMAIYFPITCSSNRSFTHKKHIFYRIACFAEFCLWSKYKYFLKNEFICLVVIYHQHHHHHRCYWNNYRQWIICYIQLFL